MDEGRWEGEGGGAIHKPLGVPEKSADLPISDLAKEDVTARTSATTHTSDASASIRPADYDAAKHHPSTISGAEPGKAEDSHYSDAQAASAPSAEEGKEAEAKAVPARKKSISERLAETWQDIKHKYDTREALTRCSSAPADRHSPPPPRLSVTAEQGGRPHPQEAVELGGGCGHVAGGWSEGVVGAVWVRCTEWESGARSLR